MSWQESALASLAQLSLDFNWSFYTSSPILYSDGVGRTGTFISIHSQLERLKTEGVIDFFQAAKSACIQRAGLMPEAVSIVYDVEHAGLMPIVC